MLQADITTDQQSVLPKQWVTNGGDFEVLPVYIPYVIEIATKLPMPFTPTPLESGFSTVDVTKFQDWDSCTANEFVCNQAYILDLIISNMQGTLSH